MIPHCWDIKFKLSTMSNVFVITSSGNVTVFFLKFVAVHWCRYLFANLEWNFFVLKYSEKGMFAYSSVMPAENFLISGRT